MSMGKDSPGSSLYGKGLMAYKFGSSFTSTNKSTSQNSTKTKPTKRWRGSLTKAPDDLNRLPSRKTERGN